MWKVPLFDLNYDEKEEAAVLGVIRSKWLTMGPRTHEFEEKFADYLGENVKALALSSCTAALHLSLLAAEIGKGDEVIISGLSFVACLNVVTLLGATPVLADSESLDDWNVSARDIRDKITSKTRAIVVVHFAGYPCNMDEICQIAKEKNILLVEDVAHAIGAKYRGRACGTFGDMACFSFFSNKNLSTGEGGMVVTSRPEIFEKLKLLRSHGMTSMTVERHNKKSISYDVVMPGLNYRMNEIEAVLGIEQLKKLDDANRKREELVMFYHQILGGSNGIKIPWLPLPEDRRSSYHIFPILLPPGVDRIQLVDTLKKKGIQTSIHYPSYRGFTWYQDMRGQDLKIADDISHNVLTLPLYPSMTVADIELVVDELKKGLSL